MFNTYKRLEETSSPKSSLSSDLRLDLRSKFIPYVYTLSQEVNTYLEDKELGSSIAFSSIEMAVGYFDQYMTTAAGAADQNFERNAHIYCDIFARVALSLSCKMNETDHKFFSFDLWEMSEIMPRRSVNVQKLAKFQNELIFALNWNLRIVTSSHFLHLYTTASTMILDDYRANHGHWNCEPGCIVHYAQYFLELTLLETTLQFKPSIVAAACVSLSRRTSKVMDRSYWNTKIQLLTKISSDCIFVVEEAILNLVQESYKKKSSVVYFKYSGKCMGSVSRRAPLKHI